MKPTSLARVPALAAVVVLSLALPLRAQSVNQEGNNIEPEAENIAATVVAGTWAATQGTIRATTPDEPCVSAQRPFAAAASCRFGASTPGSQGSWKAHTLDPNGLCLSSSDADIRIRNCSLLINFVDPLTLDLTFIHASRGYAYYAKGDYDDGILDFDEAIRLNPKMPELFAARGSLYLTKHDYDHSIQDFDRTIQLDPDYVGYVVARALAYESRGEHDLAMIDFDQATRLNPKQASGFEIRGDAYLGKGDYDHAIQDFDQTIRLDPKHTAAFIGRSIAYRNKGDYDRAAQDLGQALELDPNSALAKAELARLPFAH